MSDVVGKIIQTVVTGNIAGARGASAADIARLILGEPELSDEEALRGLFGTPFFIPCTQTNESGHQLYVDPVEGARLPNDTGVGVVFAVTARANRTAAGAVVRTPLNPDDDLQLRMANGTDQVPDEYWSEGDWLLVTRAPTALTEGFSGYLLLARVRQADVGGGAAAPSRFVVLAHLEDSAANNLHLTPAGGADLPNDSGVNTVFAVRAEFDRPELAGVYVRVEGVNGEEIYLLAPPGADDMPPASHTASDWLIFTRALDGEGEPVGPRYDCLTVWKGVEAPADPEPALSDADRIAMRFAAENARRAYLLGRRNEAAIADKQDASAQLSAFASLALAADKGLYATGAGAPATFDLTAQGRVLLAASTEALQRSALGLGSIATQGANAIAVTGGSAVGLSYLQVTGNTPPSLTGSGLEMLGGSAATFQAYNRTGGAYINLNMDGLEILLRPSGSERGRFGSYGLRVTGSLRPSSYTVATVPSASTHGVGATIYVSDESGGAVLAFSDNTNWRRVTDRAIIS